MKHLLLSTTILFGLAGLAPSAASAATYDWSLHGADSGAGTLTTGAADNGGFDILSFTGQIDGQAVSLLGGQPGFDLQPGPHPAFSPDGLSYDNIVYPLSNSPLIPCALPSGFTNQLADAYGILFTYGKDEGEIWGNGPFGPSAAYSFEVVNSSGAVVSYNGSAIFGVPEPATWAMMLMGFGLVGALRRRTLVAA